MGRLLSWVLGLAVLAYIAYWTVNHLAASVQRDPQESSQAKAILDRAREQAKQIEKDEARRAEETLRRTDDSR